MLLRRGGVLGSMRIWRGIGSALAANVVVSAVLIAGPVSAQERPGFRPGTESERLAPPLQPKAAPDISVPPGTGQIIPPEAEAIKFTLSAVTIQGSTVYGDQDLLPLYQELLGKEVSLGDVYRLAAALTLKYREDGYVLSKAVVPQQRVRNGSVLITVIEGYIDGINVEGDEWVRGRVLAYVEKVLEKRPLNIADLERYLLLANDAAGITAKSVIRPSPKNHGASELTVIAEHNPIAAAVSRDNYGSKYIGLLTDTVDLTTKSLTGWGDRISIKEVRGHPLDTMRLRQLNTALPIGNEGLTVNFEASYARSRPIYILGPLEIETFTDARSGWLSYPIIRSRPQNLSLDFGFKHKNVGTDVFSTRQTTDKIANFFARGTYDVADAWDGVNVVSVTATRGGVPWFDLTDRDAASSRPDARRTYQKYTAEMLRQQQIANGFGVTLGMTGQWSSDRMLSSEEFSAGGRSYGRGYDSGEITGDQAVAAKLELTFDDMPDTWFMQRYQLYAFYDFAATWNLDESDNGSGHTGTGTERNTLASTGLGVRARIQPWLSLDTEIARPLTRVPGTRLTEREEERKGPMLFMALRLSY